MPIPKCLFYRRIDDSYDVTHASVRRLRVFLSKTFIFHANSFKVLFANNWYEIANFLPSYVFSSCRQSIVRHASLIKIIYQAVRLQSCLEFQMSFREGRLLWTYAMLLGFMLGFRFIYVYFGTKNKINFSFAASWVRLVLFIDRCGTFS